jgi:hypothetical protein
MPDHTGNTSGVKDGATAVTRYVYYHWLHLNHYHHPSNPPTFIPFPLHLCLSYTLPFTRCHPITNLSHNNAQPLPILILPLSPSTSPSQAKPVPSIQLPQLQSNNINSTVGNLAGGLLGTVGNVVGAAGRGVGSTVNKTTGTKAVGDGLEYVTGGVEDGTTRVAKGVEDVGKGKFWILPKTARGEAINGWENGGGISLFGWICSITAGKTRQHVLNVEIECTIA